MNPIRPHDSISKRLMPHGRPAIPGRRFFGWILAFSVAAAATDSSDQKPKRYIDTHMHIGGLAEFGVQRDNGNVSSRDRARTRSADYGAAADNLVEMMDARGLARAVVVVVPGKSPRGEMSGSGDRDKVIAAIRRHPARLFLMDGGATLAPIMQATDSASVTADLRDAFIRKAEDILDGGAVGFGEMIVLHFCLSGNHSFQYTPPDHPLFLALADVAARRDVPIDIHMEALTSETATPPFLRAACSKNPARLPSTVPAFERLLAHNRNARIVWQHIGWDNFGEMRPALLRGLMERHPNLYLSLRVERRTLMVGSRGQSMPNRIVGATGDIDREFLALIRDFSDRVMIGADEFVGSSGGLVDEPHASFWSTWDMVEKLPEDLRDRIGGANAARVYRLDRGAEETPRLVPASVERTASPETPRPHPGGQPPRGPRR